jgi:hypothetical protein
MKMEGGCREGARREQGGSKEQRDSEEGGGKEGKEPGGHTFRCPLHFGQFPSFFQGDPF